MFRRVLLILMAALTVCTLTGVVAGCGPDSQKEEFKAYWNAMGEVTEKHGTASEKARTKADQTKGAFNRLAAFYQALGPAYTRAAAGWDAIEPPSSLTREHEALVKEFRRAGDTMTKQAARMNVAVKESDLGKLYDRTWTNSINKTVGRAMDRAHGAFDEWVAAAKAEGVEIGLEFGK